MTIRTKKYDIGDVIQELYPEGAAYVLTGIEYSGLDWRDSREKPTEEAIKAKLTELQADYDAKQYQRDRKYPDLGEQFDLLFKDIDSGKISKDGGFYKAIKAVKDTHPKPSE